VLFDEPSELPPQRQFDHVIPLLPKPVILRAYRYNPAQKDEVERQIKQMLEQGIIRFSTSPYFSPVILVLKKDLTWRFCVDFHQLTAITVKNRYPLPGIDEILDELTGACLFTSLDLRVGYHQIRMRPDDEHKTAFKTHNGHFEFRVMAYGLTGAPATFQGLVNTILQPLLRKVSSSMTSSSIATTWIIIWRYCRKCSPFWLSTNSESRRASASFCNPSWSISVMKSAAKGCALTPRTSKQCRSGHTHHVCDFADGPTVVPFHRVMIA
jgi:hypothetical protein